MKGRQWAGPLLAGASLVSMVLALEVGLRLYHAGKVLLERWRLPPVEERAMVPSRDSSLIFEFNPGWSNGSFSINRHGMADDEVEPEKEPGKFRLAFVGDSITANFGHRPRDEIYLELIERRLEEHTGFDRRVESLNFGVNGYGILQVARMAQTRALRFEPDVIVAQLCLNDPYPSDTPYARPAPIGPSRLLNFIELRLRPDRFWGRMFAERMYDEQGWENVREAFRGFAELERQGTPILLVLFPYLHEPAYGDWGFERLHRGYAELAGRAGLALVDLKMPFSQAGLIGSSGSIDPIHPSAEGHRVAADVILAELGRRDLLPAKPPAAREDLTSKTGRPRGP